MKTVIRFICRIMCVLAGLGLIAVSFDEGFSWYTVCGVAFIIVTVIDIVVKTEIGKCIGGVILIPFLLALWICQGIIKGLWNLLFGRHSSSGYKPFSIEDLAFYDAIFGDD